MPLYEYKCDSCGTVFEVIQRFSDPPLTVHENCGGTVERLLSAPAFQFKGTGWYVTDYARGKNGGSTPQKDSKTESKQESKKDSKPETSVAPKTESSSSSQTTSTPAGTK